MGGICAKLLLFSLFLSILLIGESDAIFGRRWRRRNSAMSRIRDRARSNQMESLIKFKLWTRDNTKVYHDLGPALRSGAKLTRGNNSIGFDPEKPTKLILYGVAGGSLFGEVIWNEEWVNRMRDTYLEAEDANVIVMDYSSIAFILLYITNMARQAGAHLGTTLGQLEDIADANLGTFHIIGRCWGAHIAGMAGHQLQGRVGRITGIDPIGPMIKNIRSEFRLDRNDAKFVDILHLSGPFSRFFLLYFQPRGHVEIYKSPNDDPWMPKDCPNQDFHPIMALFCDRTLGAKLFTDTIKDRQAYPLCPCQDYQEFMEGRCECNPEQKPGTIYMGDGMSSETRGIFQMPKLSEELIKNLKIH